MSASSENSGSLVLVADDDEDIVALVAVHLKRAGYEVVTAIDGGQALELVLDRLPDLAVIDVRMPEKTGYEVTTLIRENEATSEMPVILVSASVHEISVARGFEAGADDYLKKPFSSEELLARVEAVIGRRHGEIGAGSPSSAKRPRERGK